MGHRRRSARVLLAAQVTSDLTLDDADKLEELSERTSRAVRTAERSRTSDRTEQRLLTQIRLYGEDLARSAAELAEHIRARP